MYKVNVLTGFDLCDVIVIMDLVALSDYLKCAESFEQQDHAHLSE